MQALNSGLLGMKQLGVLLLPLDVMPVHRSTPPPAFSRDSLTVRRYPFYTSVGGGGGEREGRGQREVRS